MDDVKNARDIEAVFDHNELLHLLGKQSLNPVQLRRIFLLYLRDYFSDSNHYESEELRNPPIIFSDKKTKKTLDIDLDYTYDPEEVAMRPGIFVGLGPIQFTRRTIADAIGDSEDRSEIYFNNQGDTTLNIRHVSTTPDFSYLLANETVRFLLSIRNLLFSNLKLLGDFQLSQITPIQLVDQEPVKDFKVDVVFKMGFFFTWNNVLEGHRLKEITWNEKFPPKQDGMVGDCP